MLRTVLSFAFRHYLTALLIMEVLVWDIGSLLFYLIPGNRLKLSEAALLSLAVNLTSPALGWFLPV